MESDGDHFLAYYLTKEDETAVEFKRARLERPVNAEQEEEVCCDFSVLETADTKV
jgi:RNA polymerase II-associated factor 1